MSAQLALALSLTLVADTAAEPTCTQPSVPLLTAWESCVKANSLKYESGDERNVADLAIDECAPLKRKFLIAISACMPLDKLLEYNDVLDGSERTLTMLKLPEWRLHRRAN